MFMDCAKPSSNNVSIEYFVYIVMHVDIIEYIYTEIEISVAHVQ